MRITASRSRVIYRKLDFGLEIEQAQASRPRNGLCPVMGIQLAENMANLAYHPLDRDRELPAIS
jgi:hypothetical protein